MSGLCGRSSADPQLANPSASVASESVLIESASENLTGTEPIPLTDAQFDELIATSKSPVLVDFWAPWCGPCRQLSPVMDQIAKEYSGRLIMGKLNTDQNRKTPERFKIKGIPTVILFENGKVVKTFVGVRPKVDYTSAVDTLLKSQKTEI